MNADTATFERSYQIGEVADLVGLSVRTIRHYEDLGVVIPSARSAGGFRLYTDTDVDRLRMVKRMKPLDLTLEEIRDVLHLLDRHRAGTSDPAVQERLALYAALAVERRDALRHRLALASEMTATLSRVVGDLESRSSRDAARHPGR